MVHSSVRGPPAIDPPRPKAILAESPSVSAEQKTPARSRATNFLVPATERLRDHRGADGTKRQTTRHAPCWMGETARVQGPLRPGFFAELRLDSQAARTLLPHGRHSKPQGHGHRREKRGVYALWIVQRKSLLQMDSGCGQLSDAGTSWPNARGGLPVATQVLGRAAPNVSS